MVLINFFTWHTNSILLETNLNGHFDSVVITLHEFLAVVLFQELPDSLCIPSDSVRLPLVVSSAGVSLVQTRGAVVVKPGNKTGNAERSSSVALGVPRRKDSFYLFDA